MVGHIEEDTFFFFRLFKERFFKDGFPFVETYPILAWPLLGHSSSATSRCDRTSLAGMFRC